MSTPNSPVDSDENGTPRRSLRLDSSSTYIPDPWVGYQGHRVPGYGSLNNDNPLESSAPSRDQQYPTQPLPRSDSDDPFGLNTPTQFGTQFGTPTHLPFRPPTSNPNNSLPLGIDDVLGPSPTFGVTLPPPPEDVTEVSDEEFYSNLLFLGTLTPFRGPQEPRETAVANENETAKEVDLRRDFLTQLAYLCDYMKGGDTVTATGVQADPQIPNWEEGEYILWMAANAGCDNFEQGYIREWLEDSFFPKGPDRAKYKSDAENLKEEILSKFVNLATCPDDCRCSKTEGLR